MNTESMIHNYVQDRKEEIINQLKELIKIPSVHTDGGKKVLNYAQELYLNNGFETKLYEDDGYMLSYFGEGKKALGIFAHGDVVSAGNDWITAEPYEAAVKNGYIIGRGAKDDKSAILISLYCAKMIKELKIPFSSRLVMFTGIKEETGMDDVKAYLKSHRAPDFSIVPDNEFPVYRGNKGKIVFKAVKNSPLKDIKSFLGGEHGSNVAKATAILPYSEELFSSIKEKERDNFKVHTENGDIVLTSYGISKHSAFPEGSVNAAAIIAEILKEENLLCNDTKKVSGFIYNVASDYYGSFLGIDKDEPDFGKLTIVNDEIEADENSVTLSFNIRHGIKVNQKETVEKLTAEFNKFGFTVVVSDQADAHAVPKDHPMLKAMMKVYNSFTGESREEMLINPSGTYARHLPNAAETGLSLDDSSIPFSLPAGHGEIHQPDEYLSVEGFLKAIELTALMLIECDKT